MDDYIGQSAMRVEPSYRTSLLPTIRILLSVGGFAFNRQTLRAVPSDKGFIYSCEALSIVCRCRSKTVR